MIAIVNIQSGPDPVGICRYEVKVNTSVIAQFDHRRSDGLEACLRRAADAVRDAGVKAFQDLLDGIDRK